MKFWNGYGSEHSMNLVMIGQFQTSSEAATAKQVIGSLTDQVTADEKAGLIEVGSQTTRFTDGMVELMSKLKVYSIGSAELEQFAYDVSVQVENDRVILTTDEIDVSAFLKVMLDQGARVEVFSAHNFPDADYGRGK